MAHFELCDLSFSYPNSEKATLQDICLTIEKGEYILLCGQSGSGKTTLLRHLKPVLSPHGNRQGRILFNSSPLSQLSMQAQAAKIGFVMQNPDEQIVTDKVWHELAFGLESLGCEQTTMRIRIAEMAEYFGIRHRFHRDTALLSGGEKQLLNLASIMVMQPEVLILDEPTAQLDPISASDFLATIKKINRELGTTVIITEHRLEEVYPAADRVVIMHDGRIQANGTPEEVGNFLRSSKMCAALPTPMRVFYGCCAQGKVPMTVRDGRLWLQQEFEDSAKEEKEYIASNKAALRLKNVFFRYEKDSPDILKAMDAIVPEGSLFAIVGGNGSGKSTLLKSICGICKPYRGSIELFGKNLKHYKNKDLFQNCLCMLPQDPKSLFSKSTVTEELEEMSTARIDEIAQICRISDLLNKHPYDLSGGEQQRLALAKVLLTQPRLLLLDEPTKGLDHELKQHFAEILCKLKQNGVTIIMVTHDIEFCAEQADLVSMFFDGQLLATAAAQRFFSENSFYTTAAARMSRGILQKAVTAADIIALHRKNTEAEA